MIAKSRSLHVALMLSLLLSTAESDALRGRGWIDIDEKWADDVTIKFDFDEVKISFSDDGDGNMQPAVRLVEDRPQRMVYDSLSNAHGTPWCQNNATVWFVGHQLFETPYCYNAEIDEWTAPGIAVMDNRDDLNDLDQNPPNIDRHGCTSLDVNNDGLKDIVCGVGADRGLGTGYTELYLTQEDGSLSKVLSHGLQKYPTVRARYLKTIENHVENITHVFLSAFGTGRPDGNVNWHTMYRLVDDAPYFEEVTGPWNKNAKAIKVKVADWNNDGRDDLIVMHFRNWTMFFEQEEGGSFRELKYAKNHKSKRIRSARVADVDLDGVNDLVVTTRKYQNNKKKMVGPQLKVFRGLKGGRRFIFSDSYYQVDLPYEAPDVEVLDVNSDGIPDLYVVQTDDSRGTFCGEPMPWRIRPYPPIDWVSPPDFAQDILFVGNGDVHEMDDRFDIIDMDHTLPGCGYLVETFGDNRTLLLANGDGGHVGSNAILTW